MQTFLSIGLCLCFAAPVLLLVDAATQPGEFARRMWRQVCPLAH